MSISLQKGQKISLSKEVSTLNRVVVGLGWDQVDVKRGLFSKKAEAIDCDASVIVLTGGKLTSKSDLIYFGNLRHPSNTIVHNGDNLTGEGDGDDEQITVDLTGVPSQHDKLVFVVNIYDCVKRSQHFGQIQNAFIRLVDSNTNKEICRYNLSDGYSNKTALIFGELYKNGEEWKFSAVGEGTTDPGLSDVVRRYQ